MVFSLLVAFFAVVFGVNAFMAHKAISTFGGVEPEAPTRPAKHSNARSRWRKPRTPNIGRSTPKWAGGRRQRRPRHRRARRSRAPLAGMDAAALGAPTDRRLDRTIAVSENAPGHFRGSARFLRPVGSGHRSLAPRPAAVSFQESRRTALSAGDDRDPRSFDVRRAGRCRRVAHDAGGGRRRLRRMHPQDRERADQIPGSSMRGSTSPSAALRSIGETMRSMRRASSRRSKASAITPIPSRPNAPKLTRAHKPNGC